MTPQIPGTTTNPPEHLETPGVADAGFVDVAEQWSEARLAYPLYAALAAQAGLAVLPYPLGDLPPEQPTPADSERDLKWFDAIDAKLLAYQIRQLPPETLNASEESLRAFVRRQLKKPNKTDADRDKIDLLLVQYFALCAPGKMIREEITLEDVAQVIRPVFAAADPTPLEWCEPLEQILEKTKNCHSLRDMMEDGLLEQGRMLKDSAGCMFYDPAALVAFARFNFLLRRAFIRTLHADLSAVRGAVESLEARGVKTVDCRRAGFSAAETVTQLRYFSENWRQPFQKDYTQSSVKHAFEQLLALRADLEEALKHATAKPVSVASDAVGSPTAMTEEPNTAFMSASSVPVSEAETPHPVEAKVEQAGTSDTSASHEGGEPAASPAAPTGAIEAAKCLEAIWEQLKALPASRGRSMSTVVLEDTKVMLSSWEVAAFLTPAGQDSEDLRRAVLARALLALASDRRKRSGDQSALSAALLLARKEVSYFQGRAEDAKRAKNIEAAVNLGISTKRLLSFMEEAETLQP